MVRPVSSFMRMRYWIAFLLLLLCTIPTLAQVAITPATPPAVNQGTTFKFTANVPVIWSCPGCAGTIDPDGTYHAPKTVKSKQAYGGCQVLPNDHIYNQRIDSLPVNSNTNTWIAGAGTVPFSYEVSFPVNYTNGSTPTANMSFLFTPGGNGKFQMPAYPFARVESGWFALGTTFDKHLLAIDTTNCTFQETYELFAPGALGAQCPGCNSVSGIKYSSSTYGLPNSQGGSTDAAGLYVMPLVLRLQELEQAAANGDTIKHALRMTLQSGYCASSFIWPATAFATDGHTVPFGARFRLKANFNISGFSPIAQILLTQLKQYGLILADGGTGWASQVEYTRWPGAYISALYEVGNAAIAPSNFEAVDESSLEVSPTSGITKSAETVVATNLAKTATASQQVVLTGVTLALPKDSINIQAGTVAQQLMAFVGGTSNPSVNWNLSPAVGTLTSGGLYTPPATVAAPAIATVTATSAADPSVAAVLTLHILPPGIIFLAPGQSTPYTDTKGNIWQPGVGDDGCVPSGNGDTGWPNVPDVALYEIPCFSGNDERFDISVPNGNYVITGKFAEVSNIGGPRTRLMNLESQGAVIYSNVDIQTASGGAKKPMDYTLPATVTNGLLSFVIRHISYDSAMVSAVEIAPVGGAPPPPNPPAPPTNMKIIVN